MDLTKPKPNPTPDDYIYEQSIPDTPMTRRFGHLRGAKVKTVSETVADFYTYVSTTSIRTSISISIIRSTTINASVRVRIYKRKHKYQRKH